MPRPLMSASLLALPFSVLASTSSFAAIEFAPYINIPTGSWPEVVQIVDINNDGLQDVLLSTSYYFDPENDRSIKIFLQGSDGELLPALNYKATDVESGRPETMATGDLNNDGLLDIAVGFDRDHIQLMYQTLAGDFVLGDRIDTLYSTNIAVGDLDGDGLDDIAGIAWSGSSVAVFYQGESGVSNSPEFHAAAHGGYNDLALGDINDDGLNDIVVMSGQGYAYDNLAVVYSSPAGLDTTRYYDLGGDELGRGIAIGDLNQDGLNDVALTFGGNQPYANMGIFYQNTLGELNPAEVTSTYEVPETVAIHDIDKDGQQDITLLHGGWQRMGVFRQSAPATFEPESLFNLPYASHYNPRGLDLGDINADGSTDAVIADYNYGLVILYGSTPDTEPPLADAGSDRTVAQNISVVLDATASTDNVGLASYSWTQIAGTPVTLTGITGPTPQFTTPVLPAGVSDQLIFSLTVTDSSGLQDTDTVTITVAANAAPVADAGADQTVKQSETAILDGSASLAMDDPIVDYQWTQISGTPVSLSSINSSSVSLTTPRLKGRKTETLVFELTVTDGLGLSSTDQVEVLVVKR